MCINAISALEAESMKTEETKIRVFKSESEGAD
jgi:hypothetical protein